MLDAGLLDEVMDRTYTHPVPTSAERTRRAVDAVLAPDQRWRPGVPTREREGRAFTV